MKSIEKGLLSFLNRVILFEIAGCHLSFSLISDAIVDQGDAVSESQMNERETFDTQNTQCSYKRGTY